jgi:UDP-N-acetylmuramoyl-tripeptide--D-alanyl-D-alanine ligase
VPHGSWTEIAEAGQFIAVLGDMFELGSYEKEGHILVGKKARNWRGSVDTIGERARQIGEGANQPGWQPTK